MRLRPRFSLRSLLLASLFAGSAMLLWTVREPWAFQTVPMLKVPPVTPVSLWFPYFSGAYAAVFSPSGDFLVIHPRVLGLTAGGTSNVLSLNTRRVIDSFDEKLFHHWHPTHDWLMQFNNKTGAFSITQYPEKQILLTLPEIADRYAFFTPTGKYLVDRVLHKEVANFQFYSTQTLQSSSAFNFSINADYNFSPDDNLMLVTSRKLDCSNAHPIECKLEVFDIASTKSLWAWTCPDHVWHIQAGFEESKNGLQVVCECRPFVDKQQPKPKEWKCEELDSLSKSGNVLVPGIPLCSLIYNFDALSGMFFSKRDESIESIQWFASPRGSYSEDRQWYCITETNPHRMEIKEVVKQAHLDPEPETGRLLFSLTANGMKIEKPISVSGNKQRICACVDGSALGIWTRTRQHFEWWGLYERAETWLAIALFSGLIWSLVRDFRRIT
jgi:hypothetical protein